MAAIPAPISPAAPVLQLNGLRKAYGAGTPLEVEVLHGIDLALAPGEFAALIGPSGSGKSTLLNLIGLLDTPTAGEITVQGRSTVRLNDTERTALRGRTLGFVFQFHHLINAFSVLDNVMMPALLGGAPRDAATRDHALELLDAVGLTAHAHKHPNALSGGQQQRVAIARALMIRPPILLADEPTGNLDTRAADEVFALFRRFNQAFGCAVLLVTHDPRMAARCDRVIELLDGHLVAERAASAQA
ncbi:MAG: ABC transporter ATP-binding protein [Rubrivivax sp. SCN 70-15]|nr:MAG: ABC transporter ATP-binding protein [Rubrivivax sp. SCN 70-15]